MKKYIIPGIMIVALILSFSLKEQSTADDTGPAFYGTTLSGVWVFATSATYSCSCQANAENMYYLRIPSSKAGWFYIMNGCQSDNEYWDGHNGKEVNFCVPNPPLECVCF